MPFEYNKEPAEPSATNAGAVPVEYTIPPAVGATEYAGVVPFENSMRPAVLRVRYVVVFGALWYTRAPAVPPGKLPVAVEESARVLIRPPLSLKYNLPSLVLSANSPAIKLPAVGTAAAVELKYS